MPTPIIPKRIRLLGGTDSVPPASGSAFNRIVLPASEAPAGRRRNPKNPRREYILLMVLMPPERDSKVSDAVAAGDVFCRPRFFGDQTILVLDDVGGITKRIAVYPGKARQLFSRQLCGNHID